MSVLVDALQPHIMPSLFALRGKVEQTLDDLIGKKSAFYPSYDAASATWRFNFGTTDPITRFYANECSRFASASFQTYDQVSEYFQTAEQVPWALVRSYYAAFYAGHSILRLLGESCTYVDGGRAAILRQVLAIHGLPATFGAGLYQTRIDRSGSEINLQLLNSSIGGTHEQFWSVFSKRISQMEEDVLKGNLPQLQAQQAWDCLGKFRALISRGGPAGGWLSNVRNAVQYRQTHGVWFPLQLVKSDRLSLSRLARRWTADPMEIPLTTAGNSDLGSFVAGCTFVVAFCRALIARVADRGRRGRAESFVHYGPQRLLNTLGLN